MPAIKPAVNIITRDGKPALNVKVQSLRHWPDANDVAGRYDVTDAQADAMLRSLWDIGVEDFWEEAGRIAHDLFPRGQVYSDGRSGGWLVVDGLGDVAAWTKAQRQGWTQFEKEIRAAITYRSSAEWAHETLAELAERVHDDTAAERVRDAAPELLASLKEFIEPLTTDSSTGSPELARARAAIAKAEGRTA